VFGIKFVNNNVEFLLIAVSAEVPRAAMSQTDESVAFRRKAEQKTVPTAEAFKEIDNQVEYAVTLKGILTFGYKGITLYSIEITEAKAKLYEHVGSGLNANERPGHASDGTQLSLQLIQNTFRPAHENILQETPSPQLSKKVPTGDLNAATNLEIKLFRWHTTSLCWDPTPLCLE
jgi:hypothetical protein